MSRAVSSERLTLRATRVNISPLCAAIGTIVIGKWENDFDAVVKTVDQVAVIVGRPDLSRPVLVRLH